MVLDESVIMMAVCSRRDKSTLSVLILHIWDSMNTEFISRNVHWFSCLGNYIKREFVSIILNSEGAPRFSSLCKCAAVYNLLNQCKSNVCGCKVSFFWPFADIVESKTSEGWLKTTWVKWTDHSCCHCYMIEASSTAFCDHQRYFRFNGAKSDPWWGGGNSWGHWEWCWGDGYLATSPCSPRAEGSKEQEKEVWRCV